MLGDFLSDPILSDSPDLTLSIYGDKHQFRTSKLSSMHLHLAEGHVLGQVSGSLATLALWLYYGVICSVVVFLISLRVCMFGDVFGIFEEY